MHSPLIKSKMDLKQSTHSRAKAFVEGTKFVLKQQGKLAPELKTRINALLVETHKLIDQQRVEPHHYTRIVNRLIENLAKTSGLEANDIALGEAYWAWQIYKRPTRKAEIEIGAPNSVNSSLRIVESVIKPKLNLQQKEVLIKIHNRPVPDWVKTLTKWEQRYLKTIIPTEMDGVWSGYEKVLPATLRRIPGLSNATQRLFVFTDSDGREIKKRGYRQGVPTAYAMPFSHYQTSAEANIKQMLEAIKSNVKQDFTAYWELPEQSQLQAPVLLLGLLTHKEHGNPLQKLIDTDMLYSGVTLSGEENNTLRTEDKSKAILTLQNSYPDITLLDLNIGVNIGRGWTSGVPVDNFINKVEGILAAIRTEKPPLSQLLQTRATEAEAAIFALKIHNDIPLRRDRNKDLFSAALCHYVTEKLGGSVITNCKSAKDRTGLEIIMADAIDIYVRIYGECPKYDENDLAKRKKFLDIFKAIFDSQHHQLIANDNSPGSQGIKDEGMLDEDIIESLGQTYTLGKKIADLNKPKSFFQKNSKIIFRSLLFLGAIASIGLIATGVFAPLGLILGYVLSIALPYAVSFGVYGGYAAYDARQAPVAVKKYDAESPDDVLYPLLPSSEGNTSEEKNSEDNFSPKSLERVAKGVFGRDSGFYGGDSRSTKHLKFSALCPTDNVMLVDSAVQSEPQRTINEVKSAMHDVAVDLNKNAGGNKYQFKYNASQKTAQIFEKTTADEVVMEASTERVAMYKPLLQADIELEDKAILFLKALGIPPTDGIERIKIRGGHYDLRQAIRNKFQEYLANSQPSNQKRF